MKKVIKKIASFVLSFCIIFSMISSGIGAMALEPELADQIVSISAMPISIIENTHGYNNGAYYHYYIEGKDMLVTVLLKDGTTLTNSDEWGYQGDHIIYNGNYEYINCYLEQSEENPLVVGETYTATIYVFGKSCTVPITITESPIKSIAATPISIMENTYGSISPDGEFFYQIDGDDTVVTITMNDDTVITNLDEMGNKCGQIYYNGETFYISIYIEQSSENPLVAGNTYDATLSVMGKSCIVPVTITENPIKSITATPISIIENTNGSDWGDYYHYSLWGSDTIVTVTLNDDTVLNNKDEWGNYTSDIYYNNAYHAIEIYIEQSSENPLVAGNTYNATLSFMGKSCIVPVTIKEIKSVTATPINIMEKTGGYFDDGYFYYYISPSQTEVSVTIDDGTVLNNKDEWGNYTSHIYYNNEYFPIEIFIEQSQENSLTVGNTYEATVSVMGTNGILPITITENSVESIEAIDVKPIYTSDYVYAWNGNLVYDVPDFNLKVNFKSGDYAFVRVDPWSAEIDISDNQEETPWTVGGENIVTVAYMGVTTQFNVELIENIVKFNYMVQDDVAYITECIDFTENIVIPSEIDGYQVKGVLDLYPAINVAKELTVPDSVTYFSTGALSWSSSIETLNIGSSVEEIGYDHLWCLENIKEINVSTSNNNYASIDGVLYNKELDKLIFYPIAKGNTYTVPPTVTDISVLYREIYTDLDIVSDSENEFFVTVDGVTYTKDMKTVVSCDPEKTGEYVMPDSVTTIGECAFRGSNLEEITVSSGVTEITYGSFYGADKLTSISLPASITSIDWYISDTCRSLEKVNITDVEAWCKINFRSNPLAWAGNLYLNDTLVTDLIIPEGVTRINSSAFEGCRSITSVSVPTSVKSIGSLAFVGCFNLEKVNITDIASWCQIDFGSNPLFYAGDLHLNGTLVTDLIIPEGVTSINDTAFEACQSLISVNIPNGVTNIGDLAFSDCDNLANANIPSGVITIGDSAFANTVIKEITIPNSVTSIGRYSFAAETLEEVTLSNNISTIPEGCFEGTKISEIIIPANVETIGFNAFSDCAKLKTVDIKGQNVEISSEAFTNAPIENFDFTKVSGKIKDEAFANSKFTSIIFSETVTEISYGAFRNTTSLEDVDFPEEIITLDMEAFSGSPWYEDLNDGWVVYDNIFLGWKGGINGKWDIAPILPEGVTSIVSDSLAYNSTFSSITLPKSLKVIGIGAFQDNPNLSSIYIPENVKYISGTAFYGCHTLSDIKVAENNPYYTAKDGALYNKDMTRLIFCGKQESNIFKVPATVTEVEFGAFYSSGVEYIVFENNDVDLVENDWGKEGAESLLVWRNIDGFMFDSLPTIVCHKSDDSRIYAFAKENMYRTVEINSFPGASKNGWAWENGNWAYYENGVMLKDCWKEDSTGWCYLGSDGYMLINAWVQDSLGWCYLGDNGYCVTNSWMKDSVGWCYLNAEGRMTTNSWILDSAGWCYVGAEGYCVTNTWMKDSVGWCYLNSEGRMATNSWILDSAGWCYVGAEGYCVTNTWMKDSVGWCYLDAEGRMATNRWVMDSVGWCFVGANGYAVTNCWKQDSVGWCYLNSEGSMTKSAWVYDGGWYYLDGNGYMIFNTYRNIGGKVYNFNYSGLCTNP